LNRVNKSEILLPIYLKNIRTVILKMKLLKTWLLKKILEKTLTLPLTKSLCKTHEQILKIVKKTTNY
jgi:hypothetical protein